MNASDLYSIMQEHAIHSRSEVRAADLRIVAKAPGGEDVSANCASRFEGSWYLWIGREDETCASTGSVSDPVKVREFLVRELTKGR